MFPFVLQQPFFIGQAAAIACETAIGAYYPVAWDYDGYTVFAIGSGYGAYGFFIAEEYGLLFVRPCFAIGHLQQPLPYTLLKGCAYEVQRQVKRFSCAGKIFCYLLFE